MSIPIAVTIAGSDSGGGAGIQADLKTFAAFGIYGASVVTAVTAQNTQDIAAIHEVPAEVIAAQIDAVFSDFDIAAVKIGMLGSAAAIETVAKGLERHKARSVVLDPVMAATSGEKLLRDDAREGLRRLMAQARVVTPNLPEAAALLDVPPARDENDMRAQAQALLAFGAGAVVIKGGHAGGPESVDLLVEAATCTRFAAPRIGTKNTHGTGCTFASAIAAGLAKKFLLVDAVSDAKAYIGRAIQAADRLKVGAGRGPLHHFSKWW
jgi:hydroxymethylpyrimidine/phosphomethylpyrimidine kinase